MNLAAQMEAATENPHPGGYCTLGEARCKWCRLTAETDPDGNVTDEDRARYAEWRQRPAKLELCPITQREAFAFITEHHRHHGEPRGFKFAIAAQQADRIVGVVVVGRPVSRTLQSDPYLGEVTRLCVLDGIKNACSFLYAAAWRCARAMGYRRLVTYTLPEEGGTSLRAAGWRLIGEAGGGTWSRKDRPRVDTHPTQVKLRWEAA